MIVGSCHDENASASPVPSVATALRLRLIGQMEARTPRGESVLPTGRKTRALLAVLGLSMPRPVLRSRLAEMLWSRRPEEQARASLRQEIHRLAESLGPAGAQTLAISRDSLSLRPGSVWIDVEEVLHASPERPAALDLLDGTLLDGLRGLAPGFDAWCAAEQERLTDRARGVAEALLIETQHAGPTHAAEVVAAARRLLTIDSAHEGAWRALMRAHAARGEHGLAIQAYERCRTVLADRLAASPSEETLHVAAEIRSASPACGSVPAETRPPAARVAPRFTLVVPAQGGAGRTAPGLRVERGEAEPRGAGPRDGEQPHDPRPREPVGGVRIGALPLLPGSTGPDETLLCTGIADEITDALAPFHGLIPVSSGALARFAAQTRDEASLRRAFSLDFLLDGTLQRASGRLRVALHLLDLREGNRVVWSARFERSTRLECSGSDLLALQDEVAAGAAARLAPQIALLEAARATRRGDGSAYETMLRALPLMLRMDRTSMEQAGVLLHRAIGIDPEDAQSHGLLAFWQALMCRQDWGADRLSAVAEAGRQAKLAIALAPQDAYALAVGGLVRTSLHRHPREGLALHRRALELNPNLALAWALAGHAAACLGELDQAEEQMRRYKELTPLHPFAFFLDDTLPLIALLRRDHETAVRIGREVCEMNPGLAAPCETYLAALGHLGRTAEAEAVRERLLSISPGFTLARFREDCPFERTADREHFLAGLRRGGVAEEGAPADRHIL